MSAFCVFVSTYAQFIAVILDGYGIGKNDAKENPIVVANPVFINKLTADAKAKHLYTRLKAHGPAVGLPSESDMGNSEVGHNAFGFVVVSCFVCLF